METRACTTSICVGDVKVFGAYFVRVLNNHIEKLLDEVLELARKDVAAKKGEAIAALDAAKATIEKMCLPPDEQDVE
jgi:hypothetical protein